MTSCHGCIFRILALCKWKTLLSDGFTFQRVVMWSSDSFCDLSLDKFSNKQSSCRWFGIPWCSFGVNVTRVLGVWYCVTVACSRIFMGVDVENNLIVQCASAAAIFMRAGYWPWLHTMICFVGDLDSRIWQGLSSTWNIVSSFVDSNVMCTISQTKLVAIIWLFHTYVYTFPGRIIDKAASPQNSNEKKTSFNTSRAAFLIVKIDIHTFCLSKCDDKEYIAAKMCD